MSVDLDCNHQVLIQVRFLLQKLTSPKKYHISDFWCYSYTLRQDCNHREKKTQRNSEETQEQGHVFSKILGTISTRLGKVEWAMAKLSEQWIRRTPNRSSRPRRTEPVSHTQGYFFTLAVISSLLCTAWTLLPATGGCNSFWWNYRRS